MEGSDAMREGAGAGRAEAGGEEGEPRGQKLRGYAEFVGGVLRKEGVDIWITAVHGGLRRRGLGFRRRRRCESGRRVVLKPNWSRMGIVI